MNRWRVAAAQMDATPAPRSQRLARAAHLVAQAAQDGARLVVLPELFNAGYTYDLAAFAQAEPVDGPTLAWLRDQAATWNLHVAGSWRVVTDGEVFNALFLAAPDGRVWRYDKRYPWAWERSAFRPGRGVTVAPMAAGAAGLLVCWDVAHRSLWRAYAGWVTLMIVATCPPAVDRPTFALRGGGALPPEAWGPLSRLWQGAGEHLFAAAVARQAAWLGVPVVQSGCAGRVRTPIPRRALGMLRPLPGPLGVLARDPQPELAVDTLPACRIVDAQGHTVAAADPALGDAVVVAEVTVPAAPPQPPDPQPGLGVGWGVRLISDLFLPWMALPTYRQGLAILQRRVTADDRTAS